MSITSRIVAAGFLAAALVLPAGSAAADPNPCKGNGVGSKCRPPCELHVEPGDPANGEAPSAYWYC
jgi:hypothetical protein